MNDFFLYFSDGWADRDDVVHDLESEAWGSLSIRIHSPYVTDFDPYYLGLHPHSNSRNPWFNEFWQFNFNCTLPSEADKDVNYKLPNFPNCTGTTEVHSAHHYIVFFFSITDLKK